MSTDKTPDAFDHDDCGCEVCTAIIAAIAEMQAADEPTNAEPEAATPSTDEFLARNRARRESYEAGYDVASSVAADKLNEAAAEVMAGANRIRALEQALEDTLLSMYAMRHDPLWALSPDADVKDTALTIIYLNALQTLGRKLPVDA